MKEKVLTALKLCQTRAEMESNNQKNGVLDVDSKTCAICPYKLFGYKCKKAVWKDATKVIEENATEHQDKYYELLDNYWCILKAVWKAEEGRGMKDEDVARIFEYANKEDMLLYMRPSEVIKAWGDRHEKFAVGMIVKHKLTGKRAIVVSTNNDKFSGLTTNGVLSSADMREWENTGLTVGILDYVAETLEP